MKLVTIVGLVFLLVACSVFASHNHAAQRRIALVGPTEDLTFGTLINAPNGHISFQKHPHGFRLWEGSWSAFEFKPSPGGSSDSPCPSFKGWYPTFMSLNNNPGHLSMSGYAFYLHGCQTSDPERVYFVAGIQDHESKRVSVRWKN